MIKANRIIFLSNPQIFQLNDMIFGVANFDYYNEIKTQSNFKQGVIPIMDSILRQRNFYPLIPFKFNEKDSKNYTFIDYSQAEKLTFDVIPDIFIYPNKGLAYAKDSNKSVFVNPGCVCPAQEKNSLKGSFVKIYSYPPSKISGNDVMNRIKIEKVNIEEGI